MNNWICTDPDSLQHSKQINDHTWSYIESRNIPENTVHGVDYFPVVVHTVVDLHDYTLDEIWDVCSGYYNSFEEMVEQYGFREALHIMAECIFEQMRFDEMEFCAKQNDFEEAEQFIQDWMKERVIL